MILKNDVVEFTQLTENDLITMTGIVEAINLYDGFTYVDVRVSTPETYNGKLYSMKVYCDVKKLIVGWDSIKQLE